MLEHLNPALTRPDRVVMLGASGFVGTAIVRRLMADGVSHIALTRKAVDLLAEGAAGRLKAILQPTDSLVMTSATVRCAHSSRGTALTSCRVSSPWSRLSSATTKQ